MPQTQGRRRAAKHRRPDTPAAAAAPTDPLVRFGVVPLRLFLAVTFIYAGIQKITDAGFLNAGATTYIGHQLSGFATRSPIGGLLDWLGQNVAVEIGLFIIVAELGVGLGVLLGLWTRACAVVGAAISVLLFLSATWDVQPYFLGSDSLYAVAWVTIALVGDGDVWVPGRRWLQRRRGESAPAAIDTDRRVFLLRTGGAAVAVVWALALLPRTRAVVAALSGGPAASPTATSIPTSSASPGATAGAATPTPQANRIGTLAQLQSSGSLTYQDPVSGDPAVVVSLGGQSVAAYDAVCTHAGCPVQYDPGQRLLLCPCHGAEFDPAHGAQVVAGPAPTPLPPLKVTVAPDGSIYAA
jgi:thiosulfate dehydrogenase [quinone] large subunit